MRSPPRLRPTGSCSEDWVRYLPSVVSRASSAVTSSRPAEPVNPLSHRMLAGVVTSRPPTSWPSSPAAANSARRRWRRPDTSRGAMSRAVPVTVIRRSGGEEPVDRLDGQPVAHAPEPGDAAVGHRGDDRGVPERLTGRRVGQMQLDHHTVEGGQRVVERPRRVGQGAGVDDDGIGADPGPAARPRPGHPRGWSAGARGTAPSRPRPRLAVATWSSRVSGTVDGRFTLPQQVEIGPGQQQDRTGAAHLLSPGLPILHLRQGSQHVGLVDPMDHLDPLRRRPARR